MQAACIWGFPAVFADTEIPNCHHTLSYPSKLYGEGLTMTVTLSSKQTAQEQNRSRWHYPVPNTNFR